MKKLFLCLFAALAIFAQSSVIASESTPEESEIKKNSPSTSPIITEMLLSDIKKHATLKPSFKTVFNQTYNQIEASTGCRSSKFSLIHWINKGGEDRIFNFSSWSRFQKDKWPYEKADRNMPEASVQLGNVSDMLYDAFYKKEAIKIKEIRDYYGKD